MYWTNFRQPTALLLQTKIFLEKLQVCIPHHYASFGTFYTKIGKLLKVKGEGFIASSKENVIDSVHMYVMTGMLFFLVESVISILKIENNGFVLKRIYDGNNPRNLRFRIQNNYFALRYKPKPIVYKQLDSFFCEFL